MISFKNLFLIIEGYSEVKDRLVSNKIDTEDNIKNTLYFHRLNKKEYPTEMQNIDTYFSSKNRKQTGKDLGQLFGDLIEKTAELEKELENSVPLNDNTPRQEKINNLIKNAIIAGDSDNDKYVLLKVNSHEEAKDLTRPGENNPYGWPAQLPVTWCIAADSNNGRDMYNIYTYNKQMPFFFAFKKFPKEATAETYMAIRSFGDGIFKYTPTPNGDEINEWPNVLPKKWKDIIIEKEGTLDKKYWDSNAWIDFLKQNPDKREVLVQNNVYKKFDINDWIDYLQSFHEPEDKKLLKQYNVYNNFGVSDWVFYLKLFPDDKELLEQNHVYDNLTTGNWIYYLHEFPEDKELLEKYNVYDKFRDRDWVYYLKLFPDDKELAEKYNYGKGVK